MTNNPTSIEIMGDLTKRCLAGRLPPAPRWRASPSARFAIFAVPALIAIAGCGKPTPATWECRTKSGQTVHIVGYDSSPSRTIGHWTDTNGWVWHYSQLEVCRQA